MNVVELHVVILNGLCPLPLSHGKNLGPATSFPGFSPTRPTETLRSSIGRVGENPGNEVVGPVVRKVDNAIHRINLYPVDNAIGFPNTYPLDSDISGE